MKNPKGFRCSVPPSTKSVPEQEMKMGRARAGFVLFAIALFWFSGCRTGTRTVPSLPPVASNHPSALPDLGGAPTNVTRLGYTVQVGAFSVLDNARTLARTLASSGLDAFYFPAESGLYKVRFGDFPSRDEAVQEARRLVSEARIGDYFIVPPEDQAILRLGQSGKGLRENLVETAASFIGVDYSWGGTTSLEGFDCSGLVRAVYLLNGLNLPRSAASQYQAGTAVPKDRLLKGDLVFFSASPGSGLSHVGIYVGKDAFIHAPGKGKKTCQESLESSYFKEHFCGARAYIKE
jgi:cell wall-associated NlpC family hydrolase